MLIAVVLGLPAHGQQDAPANASAAPAASTESTDAIWELLASGQYDLAAVSAAERIGVADQNAAVASALIVSELLEGDRDLACELYVGLEERFGDDPNLFHVRWIFARTLLGDPARRGGDDADDAPGAKPDAAGGDAPPSPETDPDAPPESGPARLRRLLRERAARIVAADQPANFATGFRQGIVTTGRSVGDVVKQLVLHPVQSADSVGETVSGLVRLARSTELRGLLLDPARWQDAAIEAVMPVVGDVWLDLLTDTARMHDLELATADGLADAYEISLGQCAGVLIAEGALLLVPAPPGTKVLGWAAGQGDDFDTEAVTAVLRRSRWAWRRYPDIDWMTPVLQDAFIANADLTAKAGTIPAQLDALRDVPGVSGLAATLAAASAPDTTLLCTALDEAVARHATQPLTGLEVRRIGDEDDTRLGAAILLDDGRVVEVLPRP